MLSISKLVVLILPALTAALVASRPSDPVKDRDVDAVSPNLTCGIKGEGGSSNAYTCPSAGNSCCSSHGFCGTGDSYCLTSVGCQQAYSGTPGACYAPTDGVTLSPDFTCGKTGAGSSGYKCDPATGMSCCSVRSVPHSSSCLGSAEPEN
jgi:hypothetical protein